MNMNQYEEEVDNDAWEIRISHLRLERASHRSGVRINAKN